MKLGRWRTVLAAEAAAAVVIAAAEEGVAVVIVAVGAEEVGAAEVAAVIEANGEITAGADRPRIFSSTGVFLKHRRFCFPNAR